VSTPAVVCLTPVKNEAWILDRFLSCATLWADYVIVADQHSTDGSRDIARRHPKVVLVENPTPSYDEAQRQRLLIEAARLIPGPKVLVALDADEFLSASVRTAADWAAARAAPPGTVIEFARVELLPGARTYFRHSAADAGQRFPYGYVDDGSPHTGSPIHSPRVPVPPGAPRVSLTETVVLHFQFCDQARMESKHRWYRCYERLTFPDKSLTAIHRTYDWFERTRGVVRDCKPEWLDGYTRSGIDLTALPPPDVYWWDWEVLRMFAKHGPRRFRGLDVWRTDWEAVRRRGVESGIPGLPTEPVTNPQAISDRAAMWLLRRTGGTPLRRVVDRLLRNIW
jgi:Glycosyl transferase family 2